MTIWFVSRHEGALQWMRQSGVAFDRHVPHLDPAEVLTGDTVVGSLPVNLAAQVCQRGAAYWHLALQMPAEARGRELSADELARMGASLQRYSISPFTA